MNRQSKAKSAVLRAGLLACIVNHGLAGESAAHSRFSLNSRIGFNIKAEFKNVGGVRQNDPGTATGGVDHFYDDGFNRVDISGNANGTTWFWGYQEAAQLPGNDTIVMNSSSSAATGVIRHVSEDPQLGVELSYFRPLGEDRAYRWGIEAAIGWLDLTFNEDRTVTGSVTRTS